MPDNLVNYGDLKRKIRKLKRLEEKIRFQANINRSPKEQKLLINPDKVNLVWDEFFDFHDSYTKKVRYSMSSLAMMNKEEYKNVISEYFFFVYYRFYKENGIINISVYDPEILIQLGLPMNAGMSDIKKRFHELAKIHHPDNGGDNSEFIKLMEMFEAFRP